MEIVPLGMPNFNYGVFKMVVQISLGNSNLTTAEFQYLWKEMQFKVRFPSCLIFKVKHRKTGCSWNCRRTKKYFIAVRVIFLLDNYICGRKLCINLTSFEVISKAFKFIYLHWIEKDWVQNHWKNCRISAPFHGSDMLS